MGLTNKQAAARIVKKAICDATAAINQMDYKSVATVAEKNRLSDANVDAVKEYARGFLKPSLDRVVKVCDKVDATDETEESGGTTE